MELLILPGKRWTKKFYQHDGKTKVKPVISTERGVKSPGVRIDRRNHIIVKARIHSRFGAINVLSKFDEYPG